MMSCHGCHSGVYLDEKTGWLLAARRRLKVRPASVKEFLFKVWPWTFTVQK